MKNYIKNCFSRLFFVLVIFSLPVGFIVAGDEDYRKSPHFKPDLVGESFFQNIINNTSYFLPIAFFAKYIQPLGSYPLNGLVYGHELAPEELQKRVQEAQDAVGVPKWRQVCAYIAKPNTLANIRPAVAQADGIFLNGNFFLDSKDQQLKQFILQREAAQLERNDVAKTCLFGIGCSYGAWFWMQKIILKYPTLQANYSRHKILGFLGLCVGSMAVSEGVKRLIEPDVLRNADIRATHATNCYQCVRKIADLKTSKTELKTSDSSYVTKEETMIMSDHLKAQNKTCSDHSTWLKRVFN